ncbi:hypothetical protein QA809_43175 [Streptomyces acidiscabies]
MSGPFGALRAQLDDAAQTFADGPDALEGILRGIVDDVDRAIREPLEIFPVCHHSPASALAMARRLREKQPRVIYLELCEDMAPLLTELRNCRLPVAVQAFAGEVEGFPVDWAPLSVVAPITEASAEYQAIAYALDTPGVELVLVDRSSDHVFQWETPRGAEPAPGDEESALHGDAVGVEIGDLRPRFGELEEHLLRHGRVRHWSEWWHQYVEVPLGDGDHDTYRQVMLLIGSLFRRLAPATRGASRSTRTASGTCGRGCANTSRRAAPTPPTACTCAGRSTRPAASPSSGSPAATRSPSRRPAARGGGTA